MEIVTLPVTEGVGYVQSRGGEVVKVLPGQTIYTPPGEHLTDYEYPSA
jgi:quercetin dioxygenase-like cupin family protein